MYKERQSNIELLRIVAMLLVLVVHANYWRIGVPTHADAVASPFATFTRIFIQHLASPCVDVFVIISGYFAIRPKLSSICNLWFLLAFWGGVSVMSDVVIYHKAFAMQNVFSVVFPFLGWFIPAYLGLYLISPVLNQYAEHEDVRRFGWYLLIFFALQTFFDLGYRGWSIFGRGIFNNGYSILSFAALYLLGRYLRLHRPSWARHSIGLWFVAYFGFFAIASIFVFLALSILPNMGWRGAGHLVKYATCNSSPICIVGSIFLFLAFDSMTFSNRVVNRIAASALGVFCFHSMEFYAPIVKGIYRDHSGVMVLLMDAAFIAVVYAVGCMIDQLRILIWNFGSRYVFNR